MTTTPKKQAKMWSWSDEVETKATPFRPIKVMAPHWKRYFFRHSVCFAYNISKSLKRDATERHLKNGYAEAHQLSNQATSKR